MVAGVVPFFPSGFAESLFAEAVQKIPLPVVLPVPPEKPPVVWRAGIDVPEVSGFWVLPNNLIPNAGVVVEVDVEVAALSAGFGEAQRIHQAQGRLLSSL